MDMDTVMGTATDTDRDTDTDTDQVTVTAMATDIIPMTVNHPQKTRHFFSGYLVNLKREKKYGQ